MIGIVGGGAFGTALARVLQGPVAVWARNPQQLSSLPPHVLVTHDLRDLDGADAVLLCIPMQALAGFLSGAGLKGRRLVACCKGIDLSTLQGASGVIAAFCPKAVPAILTGPGFAADIAAGLPTALTLACRDDDVGQGLQSLISTRTLRLYRTNDVTGAELGGALKNVMAIAAGVVIGAGLGESARAALMTRGFAEMQRLALALGARAETLGGLAGMGDLILTCTSDTSRNFSFGRGLGSGHSAAAVATVEGIATARAARNLALRMGIEMPVTQIIVDLLDDRIAIADGVQQLLNRPLKQE
jgi:glycerol-3-phosphate dehydrogenase (NAD(P)+)